MHTQHHEAAETVAHHAAEAAAVRERTDALNLTLKQAMRQALAGRTRRVPCIVSRTSGPAIESMHVAEAVLDSLDLLTTEGHLLRVLRDSPCPMVRSLRESIVERYARENARPMADIVATHETLPVAVAQ